MVMWFVISVVAGYALSVPQDDRTRQRQQQDDRTRQRQPQDDRTRNRGGNASATTGATQDDKNKDVKAQPILDDDTNIPDSLLNPRWKIQRKQRKSPLQPSQVEREKQRAPDKLNRFKPNLDAPIITKRVRAACKKALEAKKISQSWTPYDLRHTAITEVRTKYGAETAQHFAGHSNLDTQRFYDHSALAAASKVAEEIG